MTTRAEELEAIRARHEAVKKNRPKWNVFHGGFEAAQADEDRAFLLAEVERLGELGEVHRETLGLLLPVLPHLIGKSVPPDFEQKLNALVLRARAALNPEPAQ